MTLLLALTGCIFITYDEADARYDQDGDGVDVFADCDDHDPAVALPGDWYPDGDGDGFGFVDGSPTNGCAPPQGYAVVGDCDDQDPAIHPDAAELCDGLDNDCDGATDEDSDDAQTLYRDTDGDGFGDEADAIVTCDSPSGYVAAAQGAAIPFDCDDADGGVHPEAPEVCDGLDNDCDGAVDDEDDPTNPTDWAPDSDGDGYGDAALGTATACAPPDGYGLPGDCDDTTDVAHPGAEEVCGDGIDNDCDGAACRFEETVYSDEADLVVVGADESGYFGETLVGGEDLTGDGVPDALIGASSGGACGMVNMIWACDGAAYLIDGTERGEIDAALDAAARFYLGTNGGGGLGRAVAAGDVTGDGWADALITAPMIDHGWPDAGVSYLLPGPISGVVDLDTDGYAFQGRDHSEQAGSSAVISDLNGDGVDDLVIGSEWMTGDFSSGGGVYVVEGPIGNAAPLQDADSALSGTSAGEMAGDAVAADGDLTGDGYPDLLVGAPAYDSYRGAVYLVEGPVSRSGALASAGPRITGEYSSNYYTMPMGVSGASDVDGDGNLDLIVGLSNYGSNYYTEGRAYVVLGPITSNLDLADADHVLTADGPYDTLGMSVAGLGDVDGDDADDFAVGAPGVGVQVEGAVYMHYGQPGAQEMQAAELDVTFLGASSSGFLGETVAAAGDVDDDGYRDLWIAAPMARRNFTSADYGAAYLFLGGRGL